jgi:multidrug efflux system membrane fusion protein
MSVFTSNGKMQETDIQFRTAFWRKTIIVSAPLQPRWRGLRSGLGAWRKMIKVIPDLAFTVAIILAATAVLPGCGDASKLSTARASTQTVVPVGVATAERRDVPVYLKGLGSVTASNTVSVKSRVDGQLAQINFKEGQNVNKGDLLAVIDPRPFQAALDQAQAALFRDQAQLKDTQLNYTRFKSLLDESGAVSQQQVDTQRAAANQLEGTVRADQALIENAKLNLTYCHITAPLSGRIGLRLVDVGNIVHAADPNPMLVITQVKPIAVIFTLPEDNLPAVAQHMRQSTLQVGAYSRDDQTKLATGTLLTIDNEIDQTTGTGKLKALFDNQDGSLWPNQFVNVRLLLEVHKDTTVIPSVAVQNGPQGSYVFVVKPDKTAEVRQVAVSFTQNNVASIASGIAPGDTVVIDGQDKLKAGSTVAPHAGAGGGNRTTQSSPTGAP